jgi:hypothetical protein
LIPIIALLLVQSHNAVAADVHRAVVLAGIGVVRVAVVAVLGAVQDAVPTGVGCADFDRASIAIHAGRSMPGSLILGQAAGPRVDARARGPGKCVDVSPPLSPSAPRTGSRGLPAVPIRSVGSLKPVLAVSSPMRL